MNIRKWFNRHFDRKEHTVGYIVRDKNGIMLMEISNEAAQHIIRGSKGRFRPYKVDNAAETVVFELLEDTAWRIPIGQIFLWSKTLLIPKVD
jgi:hypothetical protein